MNLWHRIIAALNSSEMKQIHVSNRAQLLDDAFELAEKQKLSYNITFELAGYLAHETEYEPWYTGGHQIMNVIRILNRRNQTQAEKSLKVKNTVIVSKN